MKKNNKKSALVIMYFIFFVFTIASDRNSLSINGRSAVKNTKKVEIDSGSISFKLLIKNPVIITSAFLLFFYAGSIFGLSSLLTTYFSAFNVQIKYDSAILSMYCYSL